MVIVPDAAVADVEMVRVELPESVTEAGFKLAVTPEGTPLVLSDTVPVNPLSAPTLTVYVVPLPAVTVCEAGEAAMEKSGSALTIRVTVVECATAALVPWMVRVYVPGAVELEVDTLSVEEPELLTELGLSEALAPLGTPLTVKLMVPGVPLSAATVTA